MSLKDVDKPEMCGSWAGMDTSGTQAVETKSSAYAQDELWLNFES